MAFLLFVQNKLTGHKVNISRGISSSRHLDISAWMPEPLLPMYSIKNKGILGRTIRNLLLFFPEHVFQITSAVAIGQPAQIFGTTAKVSAQKLVILAGSKFHAADQAYPFGIFFLFRGIRRFAGQFFSFCLCVPT